MTKKYSDIFELKSRDYGLSEGKIMGIKVVGGTYKQVMDAIEGHIKAGNSNVPDCRPLFIVTLNTEILMKGYSDSSFLRILQNADMVICDGVGLRAKLGMGFPVIKGRELCYRIVNKGYRSFFLGGANQVSEAMGRKYNGGWDEGLVDVKKEMGDRVKNSALIKKINKYKPEVLMVAYGAPEQERWISKYKDQLDCKIVMGVGGSFDYLVGKVKKVPRWMEKLGLEWLWRLVLEPKKRWRRQLALVKYIWLCIWGKI